MTETMSMRAANQKTYPNQVMSVKTKKATQAKAASMQRLTPVYKLPTSKRNLHTPKARIGKKNNLNDSYMFMSSIPLHDPQLTQSTIPFLESLPENKGDSRNWFDTQDSRVN